MIVSITRFTVDPEVGLNNDKIDEVISVTSTHPGWLGAYVFRSPEEPGQMVRFTYWESQEARDSLYDSAAAHAVGLTERPEGREVLELVRADRPQDPSAPTPAPTVA
jgi:heme-degrading monooxygenase HmoA